MLKRLLARVVQSRALAEGASRRRSWDFIPGRKKNADDWHCSHCFKLNFSFVDACERCRTDRDLDPAEEQRRIGWTPGDWLCTSCNSHVFAIRGTCFNCGNQKPSPASDQAIHLPRADDWLCSRCMEQNQADRIDCLNCRAPKGEKSRQILRVSD